MKANAREAASEEGFRRTLLCAVLSGLALRLLVVAFVYQSFLDPGRDHWEFRYETMREEKDC